jgi:hypothetical protein
MSRSNSPYVATEIYKFEGKHTGNLTIVASSPIKERPRSASATLRTPRGRSPHGSRSGSARIRPATAGAVRPKNVLTSTEGRPATAGTDRINRTLSRSPSMRLGSSRLASATSKILKDDKPRVFLSWDGRDDNRVGVKRLVRYLVGKGVVVYEHSGCNVSNSIGINIHGAPNVSAERESYSPGKGPLNGVSTPTASTVSLLGAKNDPIRPTTCTGTQPRSASKKKKRAEKKLSPITAVREDSARDPVGNDVTQMLHASTIFVGCVTRNFMYNLNCKKLTLWCKEMMNFEPRSAPEMRYVMMHGTFTTDSQPYNCNTGWLGYLMAGSLWSPAWSRAHVGGAGEAIIGNVKLRRSRVKLDPRHLQYIDTRGRIGVCPPCFMRAR